MPSAGFDSGRGGLGGGFGAPAPEPTTGFASLFPSKDAANYGLDFGGMFTVRRSFADTAAWEPHVLTDAQGRATVKVTLPDNLTTWRLTARGVSKSALVGEARASLVARKNLLVRVDTPRFLTQGDTITIPAVVHNNTSGAANVAVEIDVTGVGISGENDTLELGPGARGVSDRAFEAELPGPVTIEARAVSDAGSDAVEVGFGTRARGIDVLEGRSGLIDASRGDLQETFFDVPERVIAGTPRLTIVLNPGLEEALLDRVRFLQMFPYGCVEQTVHRFLPAIHARAALRAIGSPDAAETERLDELIAHTAERLRNLQNEGGSFGWFKGAEGRLEMTAYALLGLVGARESGVQGLNVNIDRALAVMPELLNQGDEDARALAHFALATAGRMDPQSYATTFRRRSDDLGIAGLAWLAMAAERMERRFDVEELVRLIVERRVEKDGTTHWRGRRGDCFVGSDREATGLAVRALIVTKTATPHVERGFAWLLAQPPTKHGTTKDAAALVAAAAAYLREGRTFGFGGRIEVLLDGQVMRTVETGAGPLPHEDRRFEIVEADALRAGRHTLGFRLRGEGRLGWAARMTATVASDELPAAPHGLEITRHYLDPERAPVEGQPPSAKPGYTVLRPSARPKVEPKDLAQVASGDRILVRVAVETERDLEYVLVEDPLPAGCEVLADTTKGAFDWQERRDDRQVFFASRLPKGKTTFEYVIQATHLGRFTALGTTGYAMYLPEQHGRAAGRTLEIRRGGAAEEAGPETTPTPDEQFARAKALIEDEQLAEALPILDQLMELPLRDAVIEEIEALRLSVAIEADSAREIVRAREALVRRNAGLIPDDLDTRRAIAFAYHELGEYEVASTLYQDLVARGFALQTGWTQTLAERGRELEGLDRLGLILRRFPISNATAQAAFQRAQRYRELPRPKGRAGGPAGAPMDGETQDALWSMTAHYAGTVVAAPATYALIGALRRSGDLEAAAAEADAFLRRFPEHHFLDEALYFLADSRYHSFEEDPSSDTAAAAVRAPAERLANEKFRTQRGRDEYSPYRAQAWHLLAQIHHVRGELDQAIALYRRAREIEDAREALAYLTQAELQIDSTTELPLQEGAAFPVRYRNVGTLELKAYPVDLQVLFAIRKTLVDLHKVDLSGIVPAHEWKMTLEGGADHRMHEATVTLPVEGDEPGVWLVIAKAGSIETSTLVIKSDLKAVLQQVGDKVRAYVTDAEGAPVRGAYVTVSNNSAIRARGVTDGRGVFEAPGVGSTPAVVVSEGERVAIAK